MGSLNPWAPMEQACYMQMDSTTRKRARKRSESTYFRISVREYRSENSSNRTILHSGSLLCAETLLVIRPSVGYLGEAVSINHMQFLTISHPLGNVSVFLINFKLVKHAQQWLLLSTMSHSYSWNDYAITSPHLASKDICNAPQTGSFYDFWFLFDFPHGFLEVFNYFYI